MSTPTTRDLALMNYRSDTIFINSQNYDPDKEDSSVIIFFKVRDRVKKATFKGKTIEELNQLLLHKFREDGLLQKDLHPLYIVDRSTRLAYELDDVQDLYENCVLEMRYPGGFHVKRKTDIVYTGMTKEKLVYVLVGLPARGKSYISRRLTRYLNWLGVYTKIFNVGQYRRDRLGAHHDHHFFDPDNVEAGKQRQAMAIAALDDMLSWLQHSGRVAVFDATNTTRDRRRMIVNRCELEQINVVFIESICQDQSIIEANIKEVKISSPDYTQMDPNSAAQDFLQRIKQYERQYEPISSQEDDLSYIQLIDVGAKIIANKIYSYLARKTLYFLGNLHIVPRPIYLVFHGLTVNNSEGRMGGDSSLTQKGERFAHKLADFLNSEIENQIVDSLIVWTGRCKAAQETAKYLMFPKTNMAWLDNLDFGEFDSMTYDDVATKYPQEYMARVADKLSYRFPHGESYEDVIQRLEPVIEELERQKLPVVVISSLPVIRALYGYFMEKEITEVPYLHVTQHSVIQITPKAYGSEERIALLDD